MTASRSHKQSYGRGLPSLRYGHGMVGGIYYIKSGVSPKRGKTCRHASEHVDLDYPFAKAQDKPPSFKSDHTLMRLDCGDCA